MKVLFVCLLLIARSLAGSPIHHVLENQQFIDTFADENLSCLQGTLHASDIQRIRDRCGDERCPGQTSVAQNARIINKGLIKRTLMANGFSEADSDLIAEASCQLTFRQKQCVNEALGIGFVVPEDTCTEEDNILGGKFFGRFLKAVKEESQKYTGLPDLSSTVTSPATSSSYSTSTSTHQVETSSSKVFIMVAEEVNGPPDSPASSTTILTTTMTSTTKTPIIQLEEPSSVVQTSTSTSSSTTSEQSQTAKPTTTPATTQSTTGAINASDDVEKLLEEARQTQTNKTNLTLIEILMTKLCQIMSHSEDIVNANFFRCDTGSLVPSNITSRYLVDINGTVSALVPEPEVPDNKGAEEEERDGDGATNLTGSAAKAEVKDAYLVYINFNKTDNATIPLLLFQNQTVPSARDVIYALCYDIYHNAYMSSGMLLKCLIMEIQAKRREMQVQLQRRIDSALLSASAISSSASTLSVVTTTTMTSPTITTATVDAKTKPTLSPVSTTLAPTTAAAATTTTTTAAAAEATTPIFEDIIGPVYACYPRRNSCRVCGLSVGVKCPPGRAYFALTEEETCNKECRVGLP